MIKPMLDLICYFLKENLKHEKVFWVQEILFLALKCIVSSDRQLNIFDSKGTWVACSKMIPRQDWKGEKPKTELIVTFRVLELLSIRTRNLELSRGKTHLQNSLSKKAKGTATKCDG